jgi:hypothetical protein
MNICGGRVAAIGFVLLAAWTDAASQTRVPRELQTVQESVERGPRIKGSGLTLVGIQLERSSAPGDDFEIELMLPETMRSPTAACVTARSQDARFTYVGRYTASNPAPLGSVRLTAPLKPATQDFLKRLSRTQLAILVQVGECNNDATQHPLTFLVADPRPDEGAPSGRLKILLNAPQDEVGVLVAASESALRQAKEVSCAPINALETVAFSVECFVPIPATQATVIELRRHRLGNVPLVDRVNLLLRPR